MCGLAGYLGHITHKDASEVLVKMGKAIAHRGPDDSGVWFDQAAGIGLSHRRLSIVDLSSAGHQPMVSAGGRYVLILNGEIYNYLQLKEDLQKNAGVLSWRGHSDTEILLACFEAWGVESTVKKTVGMFAFAVWDRQQRTLTLGRDRMGEKPLYYGWQNNVFLFASEIKALKAHPSFHAEINRDAIMLLMRHNYIPAPYSIYKDIHKLLPGTLLTVSLQDCNVGVRRYWDFKQVVADGLAKPFSGTPDDAVKRLDQLLRSAIAQQMTADVPLGAFLSGGIDSSTIVALMQEQSTRPVRTFTIGFHEERYNEAPHAKRVAQHLGTEHTELYVSSRQALDVVPRLAALYSEPFSDPSQIPTFLVSELTRRHVTIALSGDAGDELFGGYSRYIAMQRRWERLSKLPMESRMGLGRAMALMPPGLPWDKIGDRLQRGAAMMMAPIPEKFYQLSVSHWTEPSDAVVNASEPLTAMVDLAQLPAVDHFIHRMMTMDTLSYLPDGILCKVDRAAMGVSLEGRVPFLDHRVVEFAWQLPLNYKLREGRGKWPLRQVLDKYVPKELIERPKMGFGVPIGIWLRGPLRYWAESLLSKSRLQQEGYFNVEIIRQKWEDHLSGKHDWQYQLWNVLMFQAWLESVK